MQRSPFAISRNMPFLPTFIASSRAANFTLALKGHMLKLQAPEALRRNVSLANPAYNPADLKSTFPKENNCSLCVKALCGVEHTESLEAWNRCPWFQLSLQPLQCGRTRFFLRALLRRWSNRQYYMYI